MCLLTVHPIAIFEDNYVWLIRARGTQSVIVVDPGDAKPILTYIKQHHLIPVAILITHHHSDHVNGLEPFLQQHDIPVFGPEHESVPAITHPLSDNAHFEIHADFPKFRVLSIPGHTKGHIAYLIDGALFCGDTLFSAGCGRLLGGSAAELLSSLELISQLPAATKIYCSHEYTEANLRFAIIVDPNNADISSRQQEVARLRQSNLPSLPSNLALELKTNPFLRCHHRSVIQQVEHYAGQPLSDKLAVFTTLRRWKDDF